MNHFFWVYALMAAATATITALAVRSAKTPPKQKNRETIAGPRPSRLSAGAYTALASVVVIFAGYVTLVLKWEAFADYDESFFTHFKSRGRNFGEPIWPGLGRFFPLGQQEFNVLRHFTGSIFGYHAVPIAQLLIVSCLFVFLGQALSVGSRLALAIAFLLAPATVYVFTGLVFPDRNVVFWLACMLFFVTVFARSGATIWAVAAALSAQNMIYYKETAFLLLLAFAFGSLILRCRRTGRSGWDWSQLKARESRLDLCLVLVGIAFLLYYASVMSLHPNMQYADESRDQWGQTVLYYLRLDLLALLFAVVALARAYLILRRRVAAEPFWDALACGGVACYAAYLYLRMCRPYYLAPIDFIAVLYLGRLAILSWKTMPSWSKVATSVAVAGVLLQSVSLSAFHVYERENMLHAKVELANAIIGQSQRDAGRVQRLFFPFSGSYLVTEFASYLVYRGVSVEGYEAEPKSASPDGIALASPAFTRDSLCVDYRDFVCHATSKPRDGDLVVELPDDLESNEDFKPYRGHGELLFTYDPRPRIPQWMGPWLNYCRVASYRWRFMRLPDRWLHSSITLWE